MNTFCEQLTIKHNHHLCARLLFQMGLGKTLQALAVAYYYRQKWPLLIVVPPSVKYPWVDELEKWFPDIEPQDINMIKDGVDIR